MPDSVVYEERIGNGSIKTMKRQIEFRTYTDESDLPEIISMIAADLSEPYSIYVYRYFIHQWPELCFVVYLHSDLWLAMS